MAVADTARLVAELSLKDKLTAGVNKAIGSVDKLDSRLGRIGSVASRGVGTAVKNIERIGLVAGGVVVGGVVKATQAAGDFEAQLNTINTVAQVSGDAFSGALGEIGDSIRQISRDTGTSVDDLTSAYYDLVSAGISAADSQDVLVQANKLAIGGLSTTSEAVDLLTTAINSYGGDATQAATYTNMFAEAIGAGKVTASELASSFATVGPIAANFGVGIDQISAALGIMTAKGTPAAQAFTQIRAAIIALEKPNAKLKALQKETGINFEKMAKRHGLAYAYEILGKEAKKANIPIAALTGRIEGAQFAAQVTGDSFDAYNTELDRVRKSSEGAGVAQEQMDRRTQGFNFSMARLKSNVHDAAITIGSELLPEFADLAQEGTNWISTHQDDIRNFGKDLGAGIRDAVKWAKSLNWSSIEDALKTAAGFAKTMIDVFTNMPPQAQATLLALAGLNKLSGGAVAGIASELAKGAIKGVLGMVAGVVNLKAGVVNSVGGAGGIGAGAAGAGMSLGRKIATLGAVTIAGASIAALAQTFQSVNAASSQQAADIKRTLDNGIAVKTPAELQHALDGVNQGIADIQSNPLYVFVRGDALDDLNAMRASLEERIKTQGVEARNASEAADRTAKGGLRNPKRVLADLAKNGIDINAIAAQRETRLKLSDIETAQEHTAGKVSKTTTAVEDQSRQATALSKQQQDKIAAFESANTSGLASARVGISNATAASASTIVAAIQRNRPVITITNINRVTPSSVTSTTSTSERYGSTTGSAGGGSNGSNRPPGTGPQP